MPPRLDVIRAYLHLFGPATAKHVAAYLDAPVKDVQTRWPTDVVEYTVDGERRWMLDADVAQPGPPAEVTRLLGPFDLYLQGRDRSLLVDDKARAKELWPVLGRPGGVLVDGDIVGVWRPRKAGATFTVKVDLWAPASRSVRARIEEQAARLAAFRQVTLSAVDFNVNSA